MGCVATQLGRGGLASTHAAQPNPPLTAEPYVVSTQCYGDPETRHAWKKPGSREAATGFPQDR